MKNTYKGSTLDSLLDAEGIREECEARAIKKVMAWEQQEQLDTSLSSVCRFLDEEKPANKRQNRIKNVF
jgi:hypothetical protein